MDCSDRPNNITGDSIKGDTMAFTKYVYPEMTKSFSQGTVNGITVHNVNVRLDK